MSANFSFLVIATVSEWTGVVAATAAVIGLIFVGVQSRRATAVARAQATIQFQNAFRESSGARRRIQQSFPIHADYLDQLRAEERAQVETWKTLDELDDAQRSDAQVVVNAMNDVAQYVADGLPMRSALQQYHTIFVRLGFLVLPYVDLKNQPVVGHPQTRIGRRLVHLYNGAIRYHRRTRSIEVGSLHCNVFPTTKLSSASCFSISMALVY